MPKKLTTAKKNKRLSKTRKSKGGAGFFGSLFGSSAPQGQQGRVYMKGNINAPPSYSGSYTSTSVNLMPGVAARYTQNSQGRTSVGATGYIPAAMNAVQLANAFSRPAGPSGRFGTQGQTTEWSSYPNPYRDLGVSAKASLANIKTAYNSKIASANSIKKQTLNAAYSILSDPAKKAKYDTDAQVFFTTHRPSAADVMAIQSQGSPEQQKIAKSWKNMGY